jgi:hypothetical protein
MKYYLRKYFHPIIVKKTTTNPIDQLSKLKIIDQLSKLRTITAIKK